MTRYFSIDGKATLAQLQTTIAGWEGAWNELVDLHTDGDPANIMNIAEMTKLQFEVPNALTLLEVVDGTTPHGLQPPQTTTVFEPAYSTRSVYIGGQRKVVIAFRATQ